ncbi:MAG TPA: hypothetical protein VN602_06330 [Gemmatimonadaceae bacterium]|nr:hypothetical protein [Gemmatimonadaceae bacterium]
MLIDSTGLGYTARGVEIMVHYPTRALQEARGSGVSGTVQDYLAGWPIGSVPTRYWLEPPNAITAERIRLWATLLAPVDAARD